ncbi:MerR family transcriptional regulator [Variovorax sp. HJSM1_2]|uniref:MerR family transcriptional regulator n=1 Tax=Variovorax sp. HJSM1_2 TaxID=3366263 RepID=UPI003BD8233D
MAEAAALLGIAAVERDTGISKDSLRMWERRYQFPQPQRDAQGERAYPLDQVQKLRLIKRLLDLGHRAGRLVPTDVDSLQALLAQAQQQSFGAAPARPELTPFLDDLRAHDVEGLRRKLTQALLRSGVGDGVISLIAPLTTQVGELWMRGELQVFEEHIYSESLQLVLRQAILSMPQLARHERPRVLLTTLPDEQHGLGLLMAEALMALEGCECLSLGVQTPVADIVLAAAAHRADIVALSFSGYLAPNQVSESLGALRAQLPTALELWAGGNSAALQKRSGHARLLHVTQLTQIAEQVQRWRAEAAST